MSTKPQRRLTPPLSLLSLALMGAMAMPAHAADPQCVDAAGNPITPAPSTNQGNEHGTNNATCNLYASAYGTENLANETQSNAFGNNNLALAIGSNAFGSFNLANGRSSQTFGIGNFAGGVLSSAFGRRPPGFE